MILSRAFVQRFEAALALQQTGAWAEAEAVLGPLREEYPGQAHVLYLTGLIRSGQRRFVEAAGLIEQAAEANPKEPLFQHHLQEIYRRLGKLDEALAAARRVVANFPQDALAWANLAAIHRDRLELAEATAHAQHALSLNPDLAEAHFVLAEAWLLQGDFERGWPEYEWRFAIPGSGRLLAQTDRPLWNGSPLAGTLLLIGDQGFGDVIQFARFIPDIAGRCGALAIACAPEMQPLMRQIWPKLRIFDRWASDVDCDAYLPLSSLPRLCGKSAKARPYLRVARSSVAAWRARLAGALAGPGKYIGMVWAGSPEHQNDLNRSTHFATFAPLRAVSGLRLVSLQRGAAQQQLAGHPEVFDAGPALRDFTDTMALLGALDLLITVDTAVAHLAGAMGRPVWILLPYAPDWRWQLGRADTVWYPKARLFRQPIPGDWASVMGDIKSALSAI